MPKSEVTEESPWKLPEETPLPASLTKVELKEFEFTVKKGPNAGKKDMFRKWEWEFTITDGEFAGLHAWGETEAKISIITDGSRNKAAQWCETLRDAPFDIGEGVDTDDLIGLPCAITVKHDARDRSDGQGKFYSEPVTDVFPYALVAEMAGVADSRPQPDF